jgi:hypothetical protein
MGISTVFGNVQGSPYHIISSVCNWNTQEYVEGHEDCIRDNADGKACVEHEWLNYCVDVVVLLCIRVGRMMTTMTEKMPSNTPTLANTSPTIICVLK